MSVYLAFLDGKRERERVFAEGSVIIQYDQPGRREIRAKTRRHDFVSSFDMPIAIPAWVPNMLRREESGAELDADQTPYWNHLVVQVRL